MVYNMQALTPWFNPSSPFTPRRPGAAEPVDLALRQPL